jgi:hypothetical protein
MEPTPWFEPGQRDYATGMLIVILSFALLVLAWKLA